MILWTREGSSKAIRLVLQTGLLDQFKLYACESHETRARPARGDGDGERIERDEEDADEEEEVEEVEEVGEGEEEE